jgi:rubrerythrin
VGLNRTGISAFPSDSADVIANAERTCVGRTPDGRALAGIREVYESKAEPIGTVPASAAAKAPAVLIDRVAQRLAFERTGTRLYEALITKYDTSRGWEGGPTRRELERIHADELSHFQLLRGAVEEIGADPTAVTPAADVSGAASIGVLQVITDPRTTLPQSLDAILTAELTDNDGWQMLIELASATGHASLATRFQAALDAEAEHLASVRRWVTAATMADVKAKP